MFPPTAPCCLGTRPRIQLTTVPLAHVDVDIVSPTLPLLFAILVHLRLITIRRHINVASRDVHPAMPLVVVAVLGELTHHCAFVVRCITSAPPRFAFLLFLTDNVAGRTWSCSPRLPRAAGGMLTAIEGSVELPATGPAVPAALPLLDGKNPAAPVCLAPRWLAIGTGCPALHAAFASRDLSTRSTRILVPGHVLSRSRMRARHASLWPCGGFSRGNAMNPYILGCTHDVHCRVPDVGITSRGGATVGGDENSADMRLTAIPMWTSSPSRPGSSRFTVPLGVSTLWSFHLTCSPVRLIAHARTTPSGVPTYASRPRVTRPSHVSNGHCLSLGGLKKMDS